MPAEIPGFYYDTSKNRYFKIQENHATTKPSKYSRQAVHAEKVIQQAERRERSSKASKDAVTVRRSELLQHPLLSFNARLGSRQKSVGSTVKETYAASLHSRRAYSPDPDAHLRATCGKFAIDDESGTLYTVAPGGFLALMTPRNDYGEDYGEPACGELYSSIWTVPDNIEPGSVDHILSIGSGLTIVAGKPNRLPFESSLEPDSRLQVIHHDAASPEPAEVDEELFVHRHMSFGAMDTIEDIAPAPDRESIALAGSEGVRVMSDLHRFPDLSTISWCGETTAVRYKDVNVLVFGARTGRLGLCDLRAPESSSAALRIQHTSAISHIRTLGPCAGASNQILAHGLTSTSLYDLRWCPRPRLKGQAVMHHGWKNANASLPTANPTTPIVDFDVPSTRLQNRFGLGFAYDSELNMVVGASTDFHENHRVSLWDASTGKLLQSPLADHKFNAPVTCADIVHVRCNAKSILLASGKDLLEWCSL